MDVTATSIAWLRGRAGDGDNDYDYTGSDEDRSSPRGGGDQTSADGSR